MTQAAVSGSATQRNTVTVIDPKVRYVTESYARTTYEIPIPKRAKKP